MKVKRKTIIYNNEISLLRTYTLGGYEQKVLLDGKSKRNPLLLVLQGVTGFPIPFSVGCRGLLPQFTDNFIMVYWDQLGCGINNYPIDNSFTIEMYTIMATDLIKKLKQEYPHNQLIVLGTSWGSVLAAKAAEQVPNFIDNVLVYGQIAKNMFFNDEVYDTLRNSKLSEKANQQLTVIKGKKKHTPEDIKVLSVLIRKFTEGYQVKSGIKMPIGTFILGYLFSPDYSFQDFLAIFLNGFMKNESILNELIQLDLSNVFRNITVPYRILQGETDIVTSTKVVSNAISKARNSKISLRILDNNGHIPGKSGLDEVYKECLDLRA